MPTPWKSPPGRRVALVAGVRTPFAKAGTALRHLSVVDLGRAAVAELMQRTALDGDAVDLLTFGTVVPSVLAPNPAREVALLPHFPRTLQAYTVSRACASANQAITDAADQIALGHADVAVAGGAEALSQVPILHSRRMSDLLVKLSRAKSVGERMALLATLRPRDLIPITPAIAEPSTGETMGQSAERMAKLNGITREAQDALALRSHLRAAAAQREGRMAEELLMLPSTADGDAPLAHDNGVRADTTAAQLAKLSPVFDRRHGTVTAGNASPLTDGGAAVLLMSEARAEALGYRPLAFLRSYAYAAVDPADQLLQAPVLAAPLALARAGVSLADIDLVEMHEAFAAQVLSNLHGFTSRAWAERAGLAAPLGEVDPDRLNLSGGSIAIGHPFGATGARVVTSLALALRRHDKALGLLTVCAAGGLGHAMVLERAS